MTDTVVTFAQVGTTLASGGTVTSVKLTTPPKQPPGDWFTLIDQDANGNYIDEIFNIQTMSTPVPTGTVFPLYGHPFTNLVLKCISPDASYTITTLP
jgi:hypothetical protein